MPESDTSTEMNFNLYDKKGKINDSITDNNKKSSDTDYYFGLLANQDKTVPETQSISESSEIPGSSESEKETTSVRKSSSSSESSSSRKSNHSSKSKSKDRFENIDFGRKSSSPSKKSSFMPQPSFTQQLNAQEVRMKKIELLRKLAEIKQKGFSLTKDYDFTSSIEEMEYEYELLKSFVDKRNGIKIYKNILLNGVSIIEFMNEKYDPFDFHLEGWGEHMSIEVDSYDEVLEELYEKYKGTGKGMPPEIKLVLLLVASGSAFHFTKSQSTIPGLEKALSKNPELISKLINPQKAKSNFMSAQEINIEKQREVIQQRERELKQKLRDQQQMQASRQIPVQNQRQQQSNFMQQPSNFMQQQQAPSFMQQPSIPSFTQRSVSEIKVPDNVRDILNRIKTSTSLAGTTESHEESSSNNDRLVSDVNLSEGKKGKKQKSIPSISINTK